MGIQEIFLLTRCSSSSSFPCLWLWLLLRRNPLRSRARKWKSLKVCAWTPRKWSTGALPGLHGNWSEAATQADLATLSPNVTAVLSEENMQQCMEMVMEEMAEEKVVKKCVENGKGKYSDEELAKLEELATATAGIQCFLHMFQDSCKEFVGGKVYEALYSTLVPLAG